MNNNGKRKRSSPSPPPSKRNKPPESSQQTTSSSPPPRKMRRKERKIGPKNPKIESDDENVSDLTYHDVRLNTKSIKKIVCALLTAAWNYNPGRNESIVPEEYTVTIGGKLQALKWGPFRQCAMATPEPTNRFEATINWVFLQLWLWSTMRIEPLSYGKTSISDKNIICQQDIVEKFVLARNKKHSLEEICNIVNNLSEEHFVHCRENHTTESEKTFETFAKPDDDGYSEKFGKALLTAIRDVWGPTKQTARGNKKKKTKGPKRN